MINLSNLCCVIVPRVWVEEGAEEAARPTRLNQKRDFSPYKRGGVKRVKTNMTRTNYKFRVYMSGKDLKLGNMNIKLNCKYS